MSGHQTPPLLLLTSPFGDDTLPFQEGTLHAIALTAHERLSAPFEIELTAVSTDTTIDPNQLLYKPVSITVRRVNGIDRFFNGIVRHVDSVGYAQRARAEYRLSVVPSLWFLSQTVDCRIFQQQSAVEILQTLFSEHSVSPVDFRIFGDQPVREYTTQYNETDLDFVHRLLQESGYFYFFEHSQTEHRLVITDANQAFKPMQQPLHRVIYNGNNVDIFNSWRDSLGTAFGTVRLQDYDPTKPDTPVIGRQTTTLKTAGASNRNMFRWPAETTENQIAADRARFRMEAGEATAALQGGHGFDPNLCPGFRFTLASDPSSSAENVDYAVHGTMHRASDETWIGGTQPPEFDCEFTCFQQTTNWRDDLSIPRPMMAGIFSAIVLGETGEEIHADSLARVKVRPFYDYRGDTIASKAIFIRILHAWSGKTWGWQHLPRVGTEVGISFMNGDPDNPVMVGCFYNQDYLPPFPVPAEQTKQGFRSRSTLHGTTQDFNELHFDDKKGEELVFLHAQKDHKIEVEHDQNSTIGHDRTVVTERNDSLTSSTGTVSIAAAISITLRVGESTITITPASITITSPTITLGPTDLVEIGPVTGAIEIGPVGGAVEIGPIGGALEIGPVGGDINIGPTTGFQVEAAEVTLATPEFIAPPPGL
jgi:type VI secretion system secreted protein VgrG